MLKRIVVLAALALIAGGASDSAAETWPPRQPCEFHVKSTWMERPLGMTFDTVGVDLSGYMACTLRLFAVSRMTMLLSNEVCGVGTATGRLEVTIDDWHSYSAFKLEYAGAVGHINVSPQGHGVVRITPSTDPAAGQCLNGMSIDGNFVWNAAEGTPLGGSG